MFESALKKHWPNSLFGLVAAKTSAVVRCLNTSSLGITLPFSQQDHNLQSLPVHGSSSVVLQELDWMLVISLQNHNPRGMLEELGEKTVIERTSCTESLKAEKHYKPHA